MRSYGRRSLPTRAAAPRAAIRGSAIRIAPAAARTAFSRAALLASVCFSAVAILVPNTAHAQNATWDGAISDWNTPGNWTPPSVPTNTATFSNTGVTNVTISSNTSINTIDFTAAAPAYSFTVQNNATFTNISPRRSPSPTIGCRPIRRALHNLRRHRAIYVVR